MNILNMLFGSRPIATSNETIIRTIKNTDKRRYNCAGYALKTFTWFDFDDFNYYSTMKQKNAEVTKLSKVLLKQFPTMRIIKALPELQSNEYPIAFRVGSHDFHFMCRGKNKHWYHKMGNEPKINRITESEVLNECWEGSSCTYDSKIVLFAKKWD